MSIFIYYIYRYFHTRELNNFFPSSFVRKTCEILLKRYLNTKLNKYIYINAKNFQLWYFENIYKRLDMRSKKIIYISAINPIEKQNGCWQQSIYIYQYRQYRNMSRYAMIIARVLRDFSMCHITHRAHNRDAMRAVVCKAATSFHKSYICI